jgi:hypothetical protein
MYKLGSYVLTPAGKRLQVMALIGGQSQGQKITRYLLSDSNVYNEKVLRLAN